MTMWMVRAEVGNRLFVPFIEQNLVAIGWNKVGDLNQYKTREAILNAVRAEWPEWKSQAQVNAAGMLFRFSKEMDEGDWIITYNQQRRVYAIGKIEGAYRFDPSFDNHDPNVRPVTWIEKEISRDKFSTQTKNTLGSTLTLFLLSDDAEKEIQRILQGIPSNKIVDPVPVPEEEDDEYLLHDIEARSVEFIKDRLVRLDWNEMQELVAGILRAMGYKTRVSQQGADRGKDIVASRDGFGLEDPRIVVEVKHRPSSSMGSSDLRSFLGGRRPGDKGLYVSTGGFSKDAHYEAERANIPVTLMDLDALVDAIFDNYEDMDTETQRLIPLKRIYWPLA